MSNRLSEESSLYLRQHRDNPVDWWPWGEEALARARAERKPILLSIGYSACHWCHVMAHESFEDAATAQVMNALFVNIKLDREERPDLDKIYQLAHQALARRGGGWPLTVFLTPDDLLPFYAGTYFPPQARHGLPAFVDVLRGVRRWFDERPQEIEQQNAALGEFLADYGKEAVALDRLDATPLALVRERIAANFDADNGGHRGAPKFPAATELALLQALAREGDTEAGSMATLGLRRMAERGLHDHLGGGYFRYCVDAEWSIPHFEKMLNDNAALLAIYAEAAAHSGEAEFLAAAEGIVAWLQRDMALDGGGYASALDADAEGEEGRYYVWTREQVAAVLTASAPADFGTAHGLNAAPNFEGRAWHLQRRAAFDPRQAFADEREALRQHRARRVPPARDDKRLTSANALLASGLARAAVCLQRDDWGHLSADLIATLRASAWREGRLCALAPDRGRAIAGFLDDHAFLLDALLAQLQYEWRDEDADWARALADILLRDFEDRELGGFWFTPHAHEPLPQRPKPWFDEATPSGNAVAARALLHAGHLFAQTAWLEAAERTLRAGLGASRDAPQGACALHAVLHEFLHPPAVVVLRAAPTERGLWQDAIGQARRDGAQVYLLAPASANLKDKPYQAGGVAYVCIGVRCLAPARTPAELDARLREARAGRA